jgi:alpha-glucosidase (family GH31 glycosyl hydrolase)
MGLLHPEDEAVWPLRDQFYLGDAMLVAPVVTAGAVSRAVRLPAGRHVPMVTGPAVTGPVTVTVDAPLGEIPVFLRAGGIVPMTATPAMTLFENVAGVPGLETTRGDRIVYVALGASGAFTEEDGASYTLDGDGTDASSLGLGADGGLDVTGDAVVRGAGFTLTLAGHAASRKTRIVFR